MCFSVLHRLVVGVGLVIAPPLQAEEYPPGFETTMRPIYEKAVKDIRAAVLNSSIPGALIPCESKLESFDEYVAIGLEAYAKQENTADKLFEPYLACLMEYTAKQEKPM